jgi:hypothetical protein
MKITLLFCGLVISLILMGCGKSKLQTENEQAIAPKPVEKSLSGIYEFADEIHPEYFMRYDFRTDKTVVFKAQAFERVSKSSDVVAKINFDGKGVYKIDKDRVTTVIGNRLFISFSTMEDTNPVLQVNVNLFRIDGDDLIHLSGSVDGGETNIDVNETRYIRKR